MFKKFALFAGTIFTAAALSGATPVLADSNKTTVGEMHGTQIAAHHKMKGFDKLIIKRRTIFRCISTGLKKIKKGKGNAKKNARLVLKNAALLVQNLKALFPKGSHKGMTRAKKALWIKWDKFAKQAASLKKASAKLALMGGSKKGLKVVKKIVRVATNRSAVKRKKALRRLSAVN